MTTLGHLEVADIEESIYSQLEFRVSQPVAPGSNEARQMTAGSGRRLYESYAKSRPLGAFLKILLESETWASTEFFLQWKIKVTRSKSLVFQLAPSMLRTGASDSGLLESAWPTPMSRDVKGPMFEKDGGMRMDYVPNVLKATWPTPAKQNESRGGTHPNSRKGHTLNLQEAAYGITTCGCLALTEKFVVRLTTLSAWLMGYTAQYLALWATASCRKSRRES